MGQMGRYYNIYYEYDSPKGKQNASWCFLEEDEFHEVMDGVPSGILGENAKVIEIEVKSYGKRL